jgi:hypothetical protein
MDRADAILGAVQQICDDAVPPATRDRGHRQRPA